MQKDPNEQIAKQQQLVVEQQSRFGKMLASIGEDIEKSSKDVGQKFKKSITDIPKTIGTGLKLSLMRQLTPAEMAVGAGIGAVGRGIGRYGGALLGKGPKTPTDKPKPTESDINDDLNDFLDEKIGRDEKTQEFQSEQLYEINEQLYDVSEKLDPLEFIRKDVNELLDIFKVNQLKEYEKEREANVLEGQFREIQAAALVDESRRDRKNKTSSNMLLMLRNLKDLGLLVGSAGASVLTIDELLKRRRERRDRTPDRDRASQTERRDGGPDRGRPSQTGTRLPPTNILRGPTIIGAGLTTLDFMSERRAISDALQAEEITEEEAQEQRTTLTTRTLGGAGGAIAGAKLGAAIGSVVPIAGTVAGGLIGGTGGFFLGRSGGEAVGDLFNQNRPNLDHERYDPAHDQSRTEIDDDFVSPNSIEGLEQQIEELQRQQSRRWTERWRRADQAAIDHLQERIDRMQESVEEPSTTISTPSDEINVLTGSEDVSETTTPAESSTTLESTSTSELERETATSSTRTYSGTQIDSYSDFRNKLENQELTRSAISSYYAHNLEDMWKDLENFIESERGGINRFGPGGWGRYYARQLGRQGLIKQSNDRRNTFEGLMRSNAIVAFRQHDSEEVDSEPTTSTIPEVSSTTPDISEVSSTTPDISEVSSATPDIPEPEIEESEPERVDVSSSADQQRNQTYSGIEINSYSDFRNKLENGELTRAAISGYYMANLEDMEKDLNEYIESTGSDKSAMHISTWGERYGQHLIREYGARGSASSGQRRRFDGLMRSAAAGAEQLSTESEVEESSPDTSDAISPIPSTEESTTAPPIEQLEMDADTSETVSLRTAPDPERTVVTESASYDATEKARELLSNLGLEETPELVDALENTIIDSARKLIDSQDLEETPQLMQKLIDNIEMRRGSDGRYVTNIQGTVRTDHQDSAARVFLTPEENAQLQQIRQESGLSEMAFAFSQEHSDFLQKVRGEVSSDMIERESMPSQFVSEQEETDRLRDEVETQGQASINAPTVNNNNMNNYNSPTVVHKNTPEPQGRPTYPSDLYWQNL